jgi:hypothetical protein
MIAIRQSLYSVRANSVPRTFSLAIARSFYAWPIGFAHHD